MALTAAQVRVTDSDFYFDDPHKIYRQLRAESPVYWHEDGGFWVLTKFADIEAVSKDSDTYSSATGVLLTDILKQHDYLSQMFPEGIENLFISDPPRHTQLRRVMNFAFARSRIQALEPRIRQLIVECLDRFVAQGEGEVVHELSIPVTANVVKAFIDCDDLEVADVLQWSDDVFRMGSDISLEELKETVERIEPMFAYFIEKVEQSRLDPKDDFIGQLIESELDDEKLSTLMIESYLQTVMVAGNETTRNGFSAAIRQFAEFPDQYDLLRQRPELASSAVEEILRHHSPVTGFLRTAKRDTEIRGQKIAKGEHVYLVYGAANRDPDIFVDPESFDITRFVDTSITHLSFGRGPHICIGMALARLEMRILLEELIPRFKGFELTAKPVRPDSLLGNGYIALPTRFHCAG
jgi:cytochrome P450